MPEKDESKPAGGSADSGTDESAAAAKEAAKDVANKVSSAFNGLDQKNQIYLIALAVALLTSLFFSAYISRPPKEAREAMAEIAKLTGTKIDRSAWKSPPMIGLHSYGGAFWGKLAPLSAAAGIGILIWSTLGKRKEPWIPLAVAGTAGLCALSILLTRTGMGGGGDIDGRLLGWWLPLVGAVAATVVSVQRITKA